MALIINKAVSVGYTTAPVANTYVNIKSLGEWTKTNPNIRVVLGQYNSKADYDAAESANTTLGEIDIKPIPKVLTLPLTKAEKVAASDYNTLYPKIKAAILNLQGTPTPKIDDAGNPLKDVNGNVLTTPTFLFQTTDLTDDI